MIDWLKLNETQRKAVIDEAEQLSGIAAKAIEKDWWVTLALKALFQSKYREFMVFKGGTSLSKCWNLISRFSEDIDIALDPKAFGIDYVELPNKRFVNDLKRAGCSFTSNELKAELENQLKAIGLPAGIVTIEAAPVPATQPDTDPQTLFVHYPSLYEPNVYIADAVKIEVSVRSRRFPFTTMPIQSILHSVNPKPAYAETPFSVEVVEPYKTFLEKIFLLHEEFGKADKTKIRTERMSRHLYDLFKMSDTRIENNALSNHDLYDALIKHRESYSRISWVDYTSLSHETVSFIPVKDVFEEYRKDYQTMQEQMIYEEVPSFDEVISKLKLMQGRIRLKKDFRSLDEIIDKAKSNLEESEIFTRNNGATYSTPVAYMTNIYRPAGPRNQSANYQVEFTYINNELVFENIVVQS